MRVEDYIFQTLADRGVKNAFFVSSGGTIVSHSLKKLAPVLPEEEFRGNILSPTIQNYTDFYFDLDGTMLDTYEDLRLCMKAALQRYGQDVDRFDSDFIIGPPLHMSVKMFLPAADEQMIDNICREFKVQYDTSDYPDTKMYPGVESLINRLCKAGKRIYIVTNKRRVPTFRLLDKFGLRDRIAEVVTPDSRPDGYTKTEMIQMLLEKYRVNPDKAVMIGDMTSDVMSGKCAGVHTIAVTWGYGSEDALKEMQPDKLISCVDDFWQ